MPNAWPVILAKSLVLLHIPILKHYMARFLKSRRLEAGFMWNQVERAEVFHLDADTAKILNASGLVLLKPYIPIMMA